MLPSVIVLTNSDGTTREMTAEQYQAILNSRLRNVVQTEGSVTAKVVSSNEFFDEETEETRIIISFNALSNDMIPVLRAHLRDGEFQEALNLSLTTSGRPNSRYIPQLGEVCKLSIGMVENREGNQVLRITGVAPLPAATKKTYSLDDLFGESNEEVNPEPEVEQVVFSADAINQMDRDALKNLADANGIDVSSHLTSTGKIKSADVDTVKALLVEELV